MKKTSSPSLNNSKTILHVLLLILSCTLEEAKRGFGGFSFLPLFFFIFHFSLSEMCWGFEEFVGVVVCLILFWLVIGKLGLGGEREERRSFCFFPCTYDNDIILMIKAVLWSPPLRHPLSFYNVSI